MRVLLISLPQLISRNSFEIMKIPPLSIYTLAAHLLEKNIEVDIIDPCELKHLDGDKDIENKCVDYIEKRIEQKLYNIIGFSANTFNWSMTNYVLNHINIKNDTLKIMLGGLHPTYFDKHVLESTIANIVIRGEGERSIVEVCEAIKNGENLKDIRGITYKENGKIIKNNDRELHTQKEFNCLVEPAYRMIPSDNPYSEIPIESSRGCQFSCIFCSIPNRHNWRYIEEKKLIKKTISAVNLCKDVIKEKNILFVDDCFTTNPERAKIILNELRKKFGSEWEIFIEMRISNIINHSLIEYLPEDLNLSMQIGVECGYDEGLKKIKKGISIKQLYEGLSIVCNYGFEKKCFLSFIIGFPWEEETEIFMTIDTIEYIARYYHVACNVNWLFLLPSNLWYQKEKYGIKIDESCYDKNGWFYDKEIFFKVHPLITLDLVKKVEKRFDELNKHGLLIKYNKPFT